MVCGVCGAAPSQYFAWSGTSSYAISEGTSEGVCKHGIVLEQGGSMFVFQLDTAWFACGGVLD
jgi:hypothetical protein